jgi:predicted MFS family arabinose efflux permease
MTAIYVSNFVDRQILSILLQPIKQDFSLSDTQLGFLSGISFAIFYATLGIPIALWADRGNRRNIVALATTTFSFMTLFCGFAQSFAQLALARIGVGVGEAGASPPSHSMIADLYPPSERATAMATFSLGVPIGILIGFMIGGWASQLYGWRVAFMFVGAPGLVLALAMRFTVREPERGHSEGRSIAETTEMPSVLDGFKRIWQIRSLRHISLGAALNAFVGYGAITWLPSYLSRSFQMSAGTNGTTLAVIIGIAGGLGTYFGGRAADRLGKRDVRWNTWLIALCIAGAFPFSFAVYMATNETFALAAFIIPAMVGSLYLGPSLAMVQALVPLSMRTLISAILLFIINIIGLGLGPQAVGILSDALTPNFGSESLRWALFCTGFVNVWSAFHFYRAARTLPDDLSRVQARSG